MEKISKRMLGAILAGVAVVAVVIVALLLRFTGKEETYRSIQIYEVAGNAIIEREGLGSMEAVENLYLQSGDHIRVAEDSYMRLKLDDDKYIYIEENSILTIIAEGTSKDSQTSIDLEQGAITNEIQNKLNGNSSYNVTTPNSVMAVRGTIFRVELLLDEKNEIYTKIATFEGKVANRLILPNGSIKEESVLVEDGQEVTVHMNQTETEYLSEPEEIDYDDLPTQVLETLKEIIEGGQELLGISLEEVVERLEEKREKQAEEQLTEKPTEQTQEQMQEQLPEQTEAASEKEAEEQLKAASKKTQSKTEQVAETQASTETRQTNNTEDDGEEDAEETVIFTVTFVYNGTVFGTQTVGEGQKAECPKLAPAAEGAWDFDFSRTITGNTTINWK